jgi:hypothetical protein
VVVAGAVPVAQAQLVPGNFTYQFATTTGTPITSLAIPADNPGTPANESLVSVRLYLLQTGGTPTLDQLGAQGVGVRLLYNGAVARVPSASATNIIGNPAYDFITQGGAGTGTDTSSEAYVTTGIANPARPLPFPADTGDSMRMLIGTFRFQGQPAGGTMQVQAVDPFAPPNINNQTGPNPPVLLDPTDPTAGFSAVGPGAVDIDPFLAQYAAGGVIPTLSVTVAPVPEPSTLALGGLAAAGLAALRRRKAAVAAAA